MKNGNASTKSKTTKKTAVIITAVCVVVAILLTVAACLAYVMSSDKIYNGVYAGDLSLGGMTRKEAADALEQRFSKDDFNFRLKYNDISFDIYSSRINLRPDFDTSADLAYEYGRDGSLFSNIKRILGLKRKPHTLTPVITCDMNLLQYEISQYLSEFVVDVAQYSVEIGEDCLIVTNGRPGKGVDPIELMDKVAKLYVEDSKVREIEIEIEDMYPDPIDPELFVKEYTREAADAVCEQSEDNVTITPHIIGVKIDPEKAKKIIKDNKDNEESFIIPAVITYPEITTEVLEAEFTDTVIGTYSTDYSTSSANRKENIRLASEKINGMILNPGEVFSFNTVVGPRTSATGFKVAHVYSGSKVVDGIGGGICQVSSTLYNAVVFADLEIVYRTNHSMPVSYVPLGRDATVSYGTIDFKFKNNKETPIKFELLADGNNLTVNIYGRKKYQKDISIETVIVGYTPYSVSETEDDTLYEGERVVEEKGSNGTRTEAYKVVKENGEVVSKTFLAKSSYTPTSEVVRVGTKKKENEENENQNPEVTETQAPSESEPSDVSDAEAMAPGENFPEESISPLPDAPLTADDGQEEEDVATQSSLD